MQAYIQRRGGFHQIHRVQQLDFVAYNAGQKYDMQMQNEENAIDKQHQHLRYPINGQMIDVMDDVADERI